MSLSRDTNPASISHADGYVIALSSTKDMSEILYSQVGVLDGLKRVAASGAAHLLKNLSNSEYLLTVKFVDGSEDESIRLWSVAVPAAVSFLTDYRAGQDPNEVTPYDGADGIASSPLVGSDGKLIIRQGSFQSASVAGARPGADASVALLAVTGYDVILSDGASIIVHSIAVADLAAADQEISVDNYVQFEGTVLAKSAVGVSAPSVAFQAKATNMLNKSGKIQVLADQSGAGAEYLRIKVPYPSDIAEQFEGDSLLDGTGQDSYNSTTWGGKFISLNIYDGGDNRRSVKYEGYYNSTDKKTLTGNGVFVSKETYEEDTAGFTMFVKMAIGEIQKLKAIWKNSIGESEPSDFTDLHVKMDRSKWVPTEYEVISSVISDHATNYRQLSGYNVQRKTARPLVESTGDNAGLPIWVDQASGIPVKNPATGDNTDITGTYHMKYTSNDATINRAHTTDQFFIALGTDNKASLQLIEKIFNEDAQGIRWKYDVLGDVLSDRSIAISGLPSVQPGLTGRVVKEFSESGTELKLKLDSEATFGYNLPTSAEVKISGKTFSGIDISTESELKLTGLTAGTLYSSLNIFSTRAYTLSIDGDGLSFADGVQSGTTDKQLAVNSLTKGAEAIAEDFHSDTYTSPSPFKAAEPLQMIALSAPGDESWNVGHVFGGNGGRPITRARLLIKRRSETTADVEEQLQIYQILGSDNGSNQPFSYSGSNGSNIFISARAENNGPTLSNTVGGASNYIDSNVIVPFKNPTYTLTPSGKQLNATIQLNGRAMTSHMAFAVDSNPSSGESFLLEETDVPKPAGALGVRLGSLNKQLLTKTWAFNSFSGDINKYYAKADFEAGSAAAVHNF